MCFLIGFEIPMSKFRAGGCAAVILLPLGHKYEAKELGGWKSQSALLEQINNCLKNWTGVQALS
jgi:hypothetical protein